MQKNYQYETNAVHGNLGYDKTTGAVSIPIYQSATFRHPGLNQSTGYDYSRLQNPTREEVEKTIALLEGGKEALAFSTGMAAISTVLKLFKRNDHIIVSNDLYGGTYRILEEVYKPYGLETTYVDVSDMDKIKAAVTENTVAILYETPTNPMMNVADISEISKFAKEKNILTIVDNTFLTSYLQKPLSLNADLVVYSGTKYLAGHNDTLSGFIIANDVKIIEKLRFLQKSEGAVLAPFDSWLVLRGLKTLPLRMEKQNQNAAKIANFLKNHALVTNVFYAGLSDHKGYSIMKKQASGFGSIIAFEVNDVCLVEQVLKKVELVMFAESLGGTETLITYPMIQTHSAIPQEIRESIGINNRLLRLSVGIENVDDIIADLEQALS